MSKKHRSRTCCANLAKEHRTLHCEYEILQTSCEDHASISRTAICIALCDTSLAVKISGKNKLRPKFSCSEVVPAKRPKTIVPMDVCQNARDYVALDDWEDFRNDHGKIANLGIRAVPGLFSCPDANNNIRISAMGCEETLSPHRQHGPNTIRKRGNRPFAVDDSETDFH